MTEKYCPFNPNFKRQKPCTPDCALFMESGTEYKSTGTITGVCSLKGILKAIERADRSLFSMGAGTLEIAEAVKGKPVSSLKEGAENDD